MKVLLVVLAAVMLLSGCITMDRIASDVLNSPEAVAKFAEFLKQEVAPLIPHAPTQAGVNVGAWGLTAVAAAWGAWKTAQGSKKKKALMAMIAGVQKAREDPPSEAIKTLLDELKTAQATSGTWKLIKKLRDKYDVAMAKKAA